MAEPPTSRWRNWSGEQTCRPAEIVWAHTREGLIAAITAARSEDRRIRAAGSGHSFNDIALGDDTMLRLELLDRILSFDRVTGLVKVEAGIVLGDLNRRLARDGMALENLGDIDHQTLAGSISTATHGTGARFGNLSSQIESMELIGADGSLVELSTSSDPDAFLAARVGLGALGVIYSVTLRTVPAFRLDRTDRPRPLDETLARIDELADEFDHFEFYVFPHSETAICRESTRTDQPPEPPGAIATFAQEVVVENWVAGGFVALSRHVPSAIPALSRMAVAGAGKSRTIDEGYRVFASDRRVRFTEMEHAVPREHARAAIERVLELMNDSDLAVSFPIEVRFVAADDAMLSPAHQQDSCYIAVHYDRKGLWQPYFDAVAAALADFGARPHWGKRHSLGASQLAELYPRFADFRAVRERLDPEGAFANSYVDRVLGPVG